MDKFYVICYDFPSDKQGNRRRNKVVKLLEGHGKRVQYSVFELFFQNTEELNEFIQKLKKLIQLKSDSIRIYPFTKTTISEIVIIGQGRLYEIDDFYII